MMRLADLLGRLPVLASPPRPVERLGGEFDIAPEEVPHYVQPTFEVVGWPEGTRVVLIEAAGAVGKSAAAASLARRLKWPLVRAERTRVAAHSLSGLIGDALGFDTDYIQQISLGSAGVVVDSLDEAHLRVGTDNFLAFLENIRSLTKSSGGTGKPSIVLFSRADTAELVELFFADHGLPLARLRIDFFSYDSACQFLTAYLRNRFDLTKRVEYNVALANPKPFALLRDKRFAQISAVILGSETADFRANWRRMDDFTGYAPVLIAIAESLAVRNPMAEMQHLHSTDPASLLNEIVDAIMVREQNKVADATADMLVARLPATSSGTVTRESLYGPSEQIARLLARVTGSSLRVDYPATLPSEVRDLYEESVATFFPDHPFLRGKSFASVVFADAIKARAVVDVGVNTALNISSDAILQQVGPFFVRFLHRSAADGVEPHVDESLTAAIVDSWRQESEVYHSLESHAIVSTHGATGHILCTRGEGGSSEASDLVFELDNLTGALNMGATLRDVTITSTESVIVGKSGEALVLGPNVFVVCSELEMIADTLRVERPIETQAGAALVAETISALRLQGVEGARDGLEVYSSHVPPSLRAFQRRLFGHTRRVSYARYIDLRSMLTAFRASTQGTLAVSADKFQQAIVRDNPQRRTILEYLESREVIWQSGAQYFLSLNALGQFGFTLSDLKTGPNDAVLGFLVECGCADDGLPNVS